MKRIFTLGLCFVLFAFLSKVSAKLPVNKGNNSRDWTIVAAYSVLGKGVKDVAAGDFGGNFYFINPENGSQIHNGSISTVIILRFAKLDDVNNDGHPDILVAHSGTNGIVLSGFDGSTIWFCSLADKSWNVARIGDITGDNINDVIIGTLYSSNYCYFRNGVDGEELESINYYP